MRHGARPGTRSGGMDDVIAQTKNLSTEDALGHQRLGCCFCNEKTSLFNVCYIKTCICGNAHLLFLFYTYSFDTSHLISYLLDDCIVLQSVSNETVALPGLTSIASGKAVELFARMLHHPEG
jgi:ubiquitin-like modifier-activating enzyme ATG7